jgi:hypothetical protein
VIWSKKAFGLPFHDSYWQTETGSIVITNYPGMEIRPGSMGKPFPGIEATVVDLHTHEPITEPGRVGLIAIGRSGRPSCAATGTTRPATTRKFDRGWYLTGDRASIDADGYYWFVGRDDDVINTGGHLVGPFEIESALLEHEAVAESAAVGKPDPVNMEVVKVFITLKPGFEPSGDLELEIMNFVRKRLSPLAMPQDVEFVTSLPKTRSGKIMRRVLRAQEWGEPIGDISTTGKRLAPGSACMSEEMKDVVLEYVRQRVRRRGRRGHRAGLRHAAHQRRHRGLLLHGLAEGVPGEEVRHPDPGREGDARGVRQRQQDRALVGIHRLNSAPLDGHVPATCRIHRGGISWRTQ